MLTVFADEKLFLTPCLCGCGDRDAELFKFAFWGYLKCVFSFDLASSSAAFSKLL